MRKFVLSVWLILGMVLLSGCEKKASFSVETHENNVISVTAENAKEGSSAIGYLKVGEKEEVVVDTDFQKDVKLRLRLMQADKRGSFEKDMDAETTVSGGDQIRFGMDPGEYAVELSPMGRMTGSAVIRTEMTISAEETAEEEKYYSAFTSMRKEDLEQFARMVKNAYLEQDWNWISNWIRYPITLYPDVKIEDPEAFLGYMKDKKIDDSDRRQMEEESCQNMFVNGQGLCFGTGQVWLLDESYMTEAAPSLKIIALSGIVPAAK